MSISLVSVSLTPLRFSGNLADSCVQNMDLMFFTQVSLVKEVLVFNGTWLKKDKLYVIWSVPCVSLWLVSLFHSFRTSLMSQSLMVLQWASLLSSVRISVVIESDAVVSLPRLGNAFLHCHFFTGNCCSYIDFKIDFTQKRDLPLTMNKTKSA